MKVERRMLQGEQVRTIRKEYLRVYKVCTSEIEAEPGVK
jgi:hypothetical protein